MLAWAIASAFSVSTPTSLAQTLPTGGVAIHGQAQITQPAANQLLVTTQNGAGTNHSAINWQGFSIGAGASAHFAQPNAASTSINRVVTNTPSALFGNLSSNGHLVLVNQAGIAIGAGAMIDTAGFTASTLGMSQADAIAGRLRFGDAGVLGTAALTVDGQILARHGDVVLIAPQLEAGASALVQSPNGATVLAAGQQVEITGRGLEGIRLVVQAPENEARNLGTLSGDAVGIFAGTLRHSGQISATTATLEGGTVVLKATGDAYVEGQGRITATGTHGGSVDVLGNRVAVMGDAAVDASGTQGGGQIRIGGDYQGRNPGVPNAQMAFIGIGATLDARATQQGDGGRIIVWADDTTRVHGSLQAGAGPQGGNGGFIETSGKRYLDVAGIRVDASSPTGAAGTWLLDPADVTIVHGSNQAPTNMNTPPAPFLPVSGANTASITDGTINAALGTDVLISTANSGTAGSGNGDILLDGVSNGQLTITLGDSGAARTLTLQADRNIVFSGGTTFESNGVSLPAALNVNLRAGQTASGKVITNAGAFVTLAGGSGGASVDLTVADGKVWDNAGDLTLNGVSALRLPNQAGYATFNNLVGGNLYINSEANWSILSDGGIQGGLVNNAGTVHVAGQSGGTGTSWEARYSNLAGGLLNIASGHFLSMQNADMLAGTINFNTGGNLLLSETHGGARTFNGTAFTGSGQLTLGGSGSVTFNSTTGTLGTLTVNGGASAAAVGTGFTTAGLVLNGGSVTGSGAVTVTQSLSMASGAIATSGALDITQATGNLQTDGSISAASILLSATTGNVVLNSDVFAPGNVQISSGPSGSVTQGSGSLTVGGTLLVNAGTNAITLTQAGNDVNRVQLYGGAVSFTDANALTLGQINATSLNVVTSGNVTQDQAATVSGITTVNAGGSDIALAQSANDFNTVSLSGGHITVVDANALTVSSLTNTVNRNVFLQAGGQLTLPGTAINAGTGQLSLISGGTLSINQALTGGQMLLSAATGMVLDTDVTASGSLAMHVTVSGSGAGVTVHRNVSSAGLMTINSARGLRVESQGGLTAQLRSDTGQTISATYVEVLASGSQGAFIHNGAGSQSITTTGSNLDGDGLVVSNTTAAGQLAAIVNVQGAQSINVGNGSNLLVRGLGGDARIDSSGTGGSQLITVPGGWIELDSGSGMGDSFVSGVSQSVSGRRLLITGGIADGQVAGLTNHGGAQTVTIDENISLIGGGAAGTGSNDCVDRGSCVLLTNQGAGAQTVSAGSISLTGGYAGGYNSASLSSQVGAQFLTITGGGVNNYLRLTGGSGAGVNNFALVSAPQQHINFTAAGDVELVGGTNGNNNYTGLQSFGAGQLQEITGAGAVTATGGASGGADNLGNHARIGSSGAQTISAATIALQGGANGTENFAIIQSQGNQTLSATGMTLTGGADGGGFDSGNRAVVQSNASQTLNLGAGGLTLTAGGGSLSDNAAMVLQEGTGGTTQLITIGGGGDLVLIGGSSAQTNVGGTTHGSRALIEALGASQTITLSNGDVTLTGGSAGSRAFAQIYAENGTQTLTGVGALTLTGGTGGVAGEGNFASINAVLGLQTLHAASGTIQGGGAGTENFAGLFAPSQNLRFDGNLTLLGATGTNSGSGARIGGRGEGSTNLVLRVDGALALTASAFGGAAIGGNVTGAPSGQTSTITATVGGDVTLTPSTPLGVVIGAVSPNFLPGAVSITSTGGDILLLGNGGSGSGRAGIASLGNVTLVAAGDITQSPEAALLANALSVTAGGTISMQANNTATSFTASSGGDVLFNNIGALVLGGITTVSGAQNVSITSTGAMTVSGASSTDDAWQLTAGGDFTLGAALSASSVTVGSVGNQQLAANLWSTNGLNLSTSGGAIVQTAGTIVSGGIASFYGVGDINLVSATNDFQSVSGQGATVRIRDANNIALESFNTTALVVQAAGNLDVNGLVQASRVGDAIVLASTAGQLTVDPDATLQTPNGRWLLYTATPTALSLGNQTAGFIQYGATETSPILGSGNGLMYGVTPTITAVLDPVVPLSKVYDGGLGIATGAAFAAASGGLSGDIISLVVDAQGLLQDKNVGGAKGVTTGVQISGVTNGGVPVYGYTFLATGTSAGSASGNVGEVTPAPITAVSGLTASKMYDGGLSATLSGTALLEGLIAGDSVGITGGSAFFGDRHVGSGKSLTASGFGLTGADAGNYTLTTSTASGIGNITQRDVAIWSGAGGNGLWSNAANWDYLPDGANVAKVQIASGAGVVIMDVAGVQLQSLSSTRPVQQTSGSFVTSALLLDTVGGASLTGANQIGAFSAVNAGSGDIVLHNTGTLLLGNMANTAGSILIDNTGAVVSSSLVRAAGDVMVAAHSPLTIGSGGITAGNDVVLSAGTSSNPGSSDNLTLNGPLNAGNLVNLFAGNALLQNSSVFGTNGVTAVALGSFSFGPFASTNNPPVSYSVGNASVAPPPRAVGQLNEGLSNLLSFGDDFKILISGESTMPLDPRKDKPQDAIVAEGEICK